ncbi:MAG: hypothetical protein JNM41_00740 [Flavipsychrobacter sp.]|nr:hypothetical protein [Flavipsychrobacter sp.]
MNEKTLTTLQKEYRNFFLNKLDQFGVKSPAHLSKESKSKFFREIKEDWRKVKQRKEDTLTSKYEPVTQIFNDEKDTTVSTNGNYIAFINDTENTEQDKTTPDKKTENKRTNRSINLSYPKAIAQQEIITRVVSKPNPEQTNDLRILYSPNGHFEQEAPYRYPVVKMPKPNSILKLPRVGRSNLKGFKEDDFFIELQHHFTNIEVTNNLHLAIPNFSKPYEPDIVLFDRNINLYIDIEIDEPYDGFFRFPTHNYRAEDGFKQDNIRDLFFVESGWVVIRFTEKQVHKQSNECIDFIKNVIKSIRQSDFFSSLTCEIEDQWNENQSIQWQLNNYREKYLEIQSFRRRTHSIEIYVDETEIEDIEKNIQRTPFSDIEKQFDKDLHKYFHQNDKTGNAELISVTTLIERFFQFDILRYIQREAEKQNVEEETLLIEFLALRDEAALIGTELHLQIENYLTQKPFDNRLKEFEYFLAFEREKIIPRGLTFVEAEKKIFLNEFNVAGTVDCLFKKPDGRYVMVDWKRSKKLIVSGTESPDKRGFRLEIPGLQELTNCSYYRYCMQQNMYKYILERTCSMEITDMILVVLHENYSRYYTIKLPEMPNETTLILTSLNHKI